MAVTQNKIPFGYGVCNIKLHNADNTPTDPLYANGYVFEVDTNSFIKPIEIMWEGTTIYNSRRKHTEGVHLSFNLRLRENSELTDASGYCDADAILRFMHYYYKQTSDDKNITIFPARSIGENSFITVMGVNGWRVLVDDIELENVVSDSRRFGQDLILKCKTRDPIPGVEWSMFYRSVSNGNFYTGDGTAAYMLASTEDDNIYFSS